MKSHAYSCGPRPQVLAEEGRRRDDVEEERVEVEARGEREQQEARVDARPRDTRRAAPPDGRTGAPRAGSVSGRKRQLTATSTTPTTARNQKIERQPRPTKSQPPMIGAIAGARPKKSVTSDIRRCASSAPKRSRIIARPTTMPAPTERPCTTRHRMSPCTRVGERRAHRGERVHARAPPGSPGRRPKLSESAPWNRNMTPKAKRYAESVCWICSGVASSDACMPANAGR